MNDEPDDVNWRESVPEEYRPRSDEHDDENWPEPIPEEYRPKRSQNPALAKPGIYLAVRNEYPNKDLDGPLRTDCEKCGHEVYVSQSEKQHAEEREVLCLHCGA